ncbi:hypothetical protein [Mycobacterium haemophilum]|uniref:hypothetical protein n=1 Tax=Mycobacterium haemophilum TaxID=29311 RepID=UPI0006D5CDBB|nr:hypothetical protein [Mycobacterium haemophilum]MCV7339396.1 hypothetical protein [Mycobacterium haemophilum DSM 44634]
MMLDATTATHAADGAPAFVITAKGALRRFGIDDDAFAAWVAAEDDELAHYLPAPGFAPSGSTLSELVYRALSAHVVVGDPGIELNIHDHADGARYLVRLNNRVGRQPLVGLTRGCHELRWPPNDLTPSDEARHYLQEVCRIANALLADLPISRFQQLENRFSETLGERGWRDFPHQRAHRQGPTAPTDHRT